MKKSVPRSVDQNKLMWQRLDDWAQQEERYTSTGRRCDAWDYKEILTYGFAKDVLGEEREFVPSLDDCPIAISRSTSRMTKNQFSQFLVYIEAEGAMRGIIFRDTPPTPLGPPPGPITVKIVPPIPRNEDQLRAALKASCALEDKT